MATVFIEGFDKYGPANLNTTQNNFAGEWTSGYSGGQIVAGLSATGQAIQFFNNALYKTMNGTYARAIGGFRFSSNLSGNMGISFNDGGNSQFAVGINNLGKACIWLGGGVGGTVAAASTTSVAANTTHYLEFDVTIGNSGAAFQIWIDGVSVISGIGNTRNGSTNNYYTQIGLASNSYNTGTFDDLYLFDGTGTVNNAVLLTSPRVETTFPTADSSVQFSPQAEVIGNYYYTTAGGSAYPGANTLTLIRITPEVNMTINSIGFVAEQGTSANMKGVIYSDSSGSPGSLLSSGTQVTGTAIGVTLTLPLTTPQSLTAGTSYWIGMITDTGFNLAYKDGTNLGKLASNTYSSGAPATAPSMSASNTFMYWGNCTAPAANWSEVNDDPAPTWPGNLAYVASSTVGQEDLFTFGALSSSPSNIYTVKVAAFVEKSDTGTRTMTVQTKSATTDSAGSASAAALGASWAYVSSFFDTDPNTSAAWTASGLNSATSGYKIAS